MRRLSLGLAAGLFVSCAAEDARIVPELDHGTYRPEMAAEKPDYKRESEKATPVPEKPDYKDGGEVIKTPVAEEKPPYQKCIDEKRYRDLAACFNQIKEKMDIPQEWAWLIADGILIDVSEEKPKVVVEIKNDIYPSLKGRKRVTSVHFHMEPSIPKRYSFKQQAELRSVLEPLGVEVTEAIAISPTGGWRYDIPAGAPDPEAIFNIVSEIDGRTEEGYMAELRRRGFIIERSP